jgi:periplasmic divalent cation tolerance protein
VPSDYVVVLTTLPVDADCTGFAEMLVRERLAACVNVMPAMESTYRWKGNIEHDRERQVVIKTTAVRLDALQARVREIHPYDVPELLVLRVDGGGEKYLNWISEVTRE